MAFKMVSPKNMIFTIGKLDTNHIGDPKSDPLISKIFNKLGFLKVRFPMAWFMKATHYSEKDNFLDF